MNHTSVARWMNLKNFALCDVWVMFFWQYITLRTARNHTLFQFFEVITERDCLWRIKIFSIHTQICEAIKPSISLFLRDKWLFGPRSVCCCLLLFLGWIQPSAWSNITQLKNSHKEMKIIRHLESIVIVLGLWFNEQSAVYSQPVEPSVVN